MTLCQMAIGARPLDLDARDRDGLRGFADRLGEWQRKALREAKLATDWTSPDETYETAARAFLDALLDGSDRTRSIARFAARIAPPGPSTGWRRCCCG